MVTFEKLISLKNELGSIVCGIQNMYYFLKALNIHENDFQRFCDCLISLILIIFEI